MYLDDSEFKRWISFQLLLDFPNLRRSLILRPPAGEGVSALGMVRHSVSDGVAREGEGLR